MIHLANFNLVICYVLSQIIIYTESNNWDQKPHKNSLHQHNISDHENDDHNSGENFQHYLASNLYSSDDTLNKLRLIQEFKRHCSNNNTLHQSLLQSIGAHYGSLAQQTFLPSESTNQFNMHNSTLGVNSLIGTVQRDMNLPSTSSGVNNRQNNHLENSPELIQSNSSSPNSLNGSTAGVNDDAHRQLYEFDNDPRRKEFLDELFTFMQRRGTAIARLPIMAKQVLDLYQLYNLVVQRGGLVEVINKKLWQEIIKGLNLPASITSAAFTLRTQYMKYLYPYEQDKLHLSTNEELQAAIDGNKRETRNKTSYPSYMDNLQSSRRSPIIPIFLNNAQGQHFGHQQNMHLNASNNSLLGNRNFNLATGGSSHASSSLSTPNSNHASEMEARMLEYSLNLARELPPQNSTTSFLTPQMQALIGQSLQPPLTPEEIHRFSTLWNICSTGQFANMAVAASVFSATRNATSTPSVQTESIAHSSRGPTSTITSGSLAGPSASTASSLSVKRTESEMEPQDEALNLSETSHNQQQTQNRNIPTNRTNGHQKRLRLDSSERTTTNNYEPCIPLNIRVLSQDAEQVNIRMEIGDKEYAGILERKSDSEDVQDEEEIDDDDDEDDVDREDAQ